MNLFLNVKTKTVISIIRKLYPGVKWTYHKWLRRWEGSDGSCINRCAALAPGYDGDDDTFSSEYWRYFPTEQNKIPERVWLR